MAGNIVQQTRDHREYHHLRWHYLNGAGYQNAEVNAGNRATIYRGTAVALVEGPHLYKLNGYYYLFAAQGGTVFTHPEVVARSKPSGRQLRNRAGRRVLNQRRYPRTATSRNRAMARWSPPEGEWYYASLCARPWENRPGIYLRPARHSQPRPGNLDPEVCWDDEGLAAY